MQDCPKCKKVAAFARRLKKSDTSGRIGNSVQDKRTAYLRGQALQSIRIGEELEKLLGQPEGK